MTISHAGEAPHRDGLVEALQHPAPGRVEHQVVVVLQRLDHRSVDQRLTRDRRVDQARRQVHHRAVVVAVPEEDLAEDQAAARLRAVLGERLDQVADDAHPGRRVDSRHHDLVADELHQATATGGDDVEGPRLEAADLGPEVRGVEPGLQRRRAHEIDEPDRHAGQVAAGDTLLDDPLAGHGLAHVVPEHGAEPVAELEGQLRGLQVGRGAVEHGGPAAAELLLGPLDVDSHRRLGDALHGSGHHPEEGVALGDADATAQIARLEDAPHEPDVDVGELRRVEIGDRHAEVVVDRHDLAQREARSFGEVTGRQHGVAPEDEVAAEAGSLVGERIGGVRVGTLLDQPGP